MMQPDFNPHYSFRQLETLMKYLKDDKETIYFWYQGGVSDYKDFIALNQSQNCGLKLPKFVSVSTNPDDYIALPFKRWDTNERFYLIDMFPTSFPFGTESTSLSRYSANKEKESFLQIFSHRRGKIFRMWPGNGLKGPEAEDEDELQQEEKEQDLISSDAEGKERNMRNQEIQKKEQEGEDEFDKLSKKVRDIDMEEKEKKKHVRLRVFTFNDSEAFEKLIASILGRN